MSANKPAGAYQPRIYKQSLALVIIPLCLSTGLLILLFQLSLRAEKSLANENHQAQLVRSLNFASMRVWLSRLEALTAKDSRSREHVNKLKAMFGTEAEDINAFMNFKSGQQLDFTRLEKLPKLLSLIYKQNSEIKELINAEWLDLKELREHSDGTRILEKNLALTCSLANSLLAIILMSLFANSIAKRLGLLVQNAGQVPRLDKFKNRLSGNDEFAYLNKVLEQARQRLEDDAEHRRSIVGMVAHDMRAPLMSAQASLQMVEELGADFEDDSYYALDKAYKNLSSIIKYVSELLKIQKQEALSSEPSTYETKTYGEDRDARSSKLANWEQEFNQKGIKNFFAALFIRPRIIHKGLLLVIFPLLLQFGFLIFINQQIALSEQSIHRSRKLSDIMLYSLSAALDFLRGSVTQAIFIFSGKDSYRKLALRIFANNDRLYDQMEQLAGKNPEWLEIIAHEKASFLAQRKEIMNMTSQTPMQEIAERFLKIGQSRDNGASAEATQKSKKVALLTEREIRELDSLERAQAALGRRLPLILAATMAANFILAIVLLRLFNGDINKRLKQLIQNAANLSSKELFANQVAGNDELSFLDLILHDAKNQIEDNSRRRTEMMQALASEIRTPLLEAAEKLSFIHEKDLAALPPESQEFLTRAESNVEKVSVLLDDLLTVEALSVGEIQLEKTNCDLAEIAQETINSIYLLAQEKNISLENKCTAIQLFADKRRLAQVLQNYLTNAIKFSENDSPIVISSNQTESFIRLSVIDSGVGMDEDARQRVFEKFFQTKAEHAKQGFGLGLAICKLIIDAHAGRVGVESSPGHGSTFYFELPRTESPSPLR